MVHQEALSRGLKVPNRTYPEEITEADKNRNREKLINRKLVLSCGKLFGGLFVELWLEETIADHVKKRRTGSDLVLCILILQNT